MRSFITAKNAAALDRDLMSIAGFSLGQLMELAGLSVSQAIHRVHPLGLGPRILVICGPGNNGGDGLVAARHLWHYGYRPTIYYPKPNKNDLFQSLSKQLEHLNIPFADDFAKALNESDHIVDAIFGFSFAGEIREPFPSIIKALQETTIPITSIDVPSSWDVENGPPVSGLGSTFKPKSLVSLTAPKPLVTYFKGRHFVGGRFLSPQLQDKYGLVAYQFEGTDQIIEIENGVEV
ncbi:unnamed protein product [Blumeria hordei]|uniref:NAD(P)H-hydrate epimerase n=2 Tax=Blumeria hordei TaxID=2867405 RepID=A0A383V1Q4_BLUHO|nr:hypothetical protein BGHDH14_bgh05953 [Blumeria hordei DH14]SZF05755.1 unnamed protein product [Blumeria hordei]